MKKILLLFLVASYSFANTAQTNKCETKRKVFIDNAQTKVWQTTICPNQSLAYHTHQTARVVTAEKNVTLLVKYKSGEQRTIVLKANTPKFLSKKQGLEPHQDVNLSGTAIKLTVVELKN
ncbi:hypothetical protein [Legionella sainthelensi]|uniref:Uncharacterized protein n=1 Tax=Legionella sainthelensi TaxID=28087 RepID=A0A2H5FII1_9GAMM|nr:hypothetical protein [Legionella sainthelensi]AUH71360.1 hypothetical protein CAB17_04230 [Legionella sainthelensi]